jgi:hypothetical protein
LENYWLPRRNTLQEHCRLLGAQQSQAASITFEDVASTVGEGIIGFTVIPPIAYEPALLVKTEKILIDEPQIARLPGLPISVDKWFSGNPLPTGIRHLGTIRLKSSEPGTKPVAKRVKVPKCGIAADQAEDKGVFFCRCNRHQVTPAS